MQDEANLWLWLFLCPDINECSLSSVLCGPNSVCKNLPGRYRCSCLDGYFSPIGDNWIPKKPGDHFCTGNAPRLRVGLWLTATIELGTSVSNLIQPIYCLLILHCSSDINECLTGDVCPEYSECANSLGSYSCHCQDGFTLNNSTCEGIEDLLFFIHLLNEESLHLKILWNRDDEPPFQNHKIEAQRGEVTCSRTHSH